MTWSSNSTSVAEIRQAWSDNKAGALLNDRNT